MSNFELGWLKDNQGEKIAPRTIASAVSMSDGTSVADNIDELNQDLTNFKKHNILLPSIDISSYTDSSRCYECPCDGYVRITTSGGTISLLSNQNEVFNLLEGNGKSVSVFVRKGSRIVVGGDSLNTAKFLKLV